MALDMTYLKEIVLGLIALALVGGIVLSSFALWMIIKLLHWAAQLMV